MALCRKNGYAKVCLGCDGKRCLKGKREHDDESRSSTVDDVGVSLFSSFGDSGTSSSSCDTDYPSSSSDSGSCSFGD